MKYVRFEGLVQNEGTSSRLGIFQLAHELKDSLQLSTYEENELRRHLEWMDKNLTAPDLLQKREHHRAIFWFKDTAAEPLKRIWAIKQILKEWDIWIDQIKVSKPGVIIYEDEWQVAAKPYRAQAKGDHYAH